MDALEFQRASRRTRNALSYPEALANAALGLVGEAGEVSELVKKQLFHGKDPNMKDVLHEIGDVMFYAAWICDMYQLDLRQVFEANVEKLKERWPEGFKEGAA